MLLEGSGLIVSLPARELAGFRPSGSLFGEEELRKAALSAELASALKAVRQFCAARQVSLRFLAHPEIFTHGDSLAWLHRRLGGITDHLCLSDGYAVRPVPSMRNHLFLYRLGSYESAVAFQRLSHCAPELLGSLTTQVNTAMDFGGNTKSIAPPPVLLQVLRQQGHRRTASARWHFYAPHRSGEGNMGRMLASDVSPAAVFRDVQRVAYVPLTTSACHDPAFRKIVAKLVSACVADESQGCVIRLPELTAAAADTGSLTAASKELVRALSRVKARPKSKRRPAVALTGADLIEQWPVALTCPVDLVLHSSYEFWRHPRERYRCFRDITVFSMQGAASSEVELRKLLSLALGRACE